MPFPVHRWRRLGRTPHLDRAADLDRSGNDLTTDRGQIDRLREAPDDWVTRLGFHEKYRPFVEKWSRADGLTADEAEQLTPEILDQAADSVRKLVYDPSRMFRGWLRRFVYCRVVDYRRRRGAPPQNLGDSTDRIADPRAEPDLDPDEAPELTVEEATFRFLAQETQERVRRRRKASTWDSFVKVYLDGLSHKEAAAILGMKEDTVRKNVDRVLEHLRTEGAIVLAEYARRASEET